MQLPAPSMSLLPSMFRYIALIEFKLDTAVRAIFDELYQNWKLTKVIMIFNIMITLVSFVNLDFFSRSISSIMYKFKPR